MAIAKHLGKAIFSGFLVLAVSASLHAQTDTSARLAGAVRDQSGAIIPGARVELSNPALALTMDRETDESGQYVFPAVAPGTYTVVVTKSGFRAATLSALRLEVAKSYAQDFVLDVGDVSQSVEVTGTTGAELQTTDATVGSVIDSKLMIELPSLTRGTTEFLYLQPGSIPGTGSVPGTGIAGGAGAFGLTGNTIAGARSDQSAFSLDGIDISDVFLGGSALPGAFAFSPTIVPTSVETVEEFRVGVSTPNASFSRAGGGQVSLVSRSGTNAFHGAAFYYHQNDNLNANTWTNNRLGVEEPELKDNRFGVRVGGPILREKTFFFGSYEGRRFPNSTSVLRTVPTDTLRQGILRFRDASGNVVSYDLTSAAVCGAGGNLPCDPRGIGFSPAVQAIFAELPQGNDPAVGDGLNTIGFRGNASVPITNNLYTARIDHNLTSQWRLYGSFRYTESESSSARQVRIQGGNIRALNDSPFDSKLVSATLQGSLSTNLTSQFRFGWIRSESGIDATDPAASAAELSIPGTQIGSAGFVALDLGGISEPIDNAAALARVQFTDTDIYQYGADLTWVKDRHTVQFGGSLRYLPVKHVRNNSVNVSTSPVAFLTTGANLFALSPDNRPPACSGAVTMNCLQTNNVGSWDTLYSALLGIVDSTQFIATRDGDFAPSPPGTPWGVDTTQYSTDLYVQDVWQVHPTLTLTYGLSYVAQSTPKDKNNRFSLLIDNTTGEVIRAKRYFDQRSQSALQGQIFNPQLAYLPLNSAQTDDIFDADWNNFGPRASAAWKPSFDSGVLGTLLGKNKTVIRGGYSLIYDRNNTVQSVLFPQLSSLGFFTPLLNAAPLCDASGSPGASCNTANPGNVGLASFRAGVDGQIPLQTVPPGNIPFVPSGVGGFVLGIDPALEIGENHTASLTVQRELRWNMMIEIGWIGRYARKLPQNYDLRAVPMFMAEPTSGQTMAEAIDALADELEAGVLPANVTPQPWFEAFAPLASFDVPAPNNTANVANNGSFLLQNNFNFFLVAGQIDFRRAFNGLTPIANRQFLGELMLRQSNGRSNYNGVLVTLRRRVADGLTFDMNYTWSKSLDQLGDVQNDIVSNSSPWDPDIDYGPSFFDRTHVFNLFGLYELPFQSTSRPAVNRLIDGWQFSWIFRAYSGLPLRVVRDFAVPFGGGFFTPSAGDIPIGSPQNASLNRNVTGSNGVGINSDPANGGTGLNIFSNPEAVLANFRRIRVSEDGRTGRANSFRGLGRWNLDLSVRKNTRVNEHVQVVFSADFFNIFNKVDFFDPIFFFYNEVDRLDTAQFGVINHQFVPADRASGSRWIQFGLRVEF